MQTLHRTQVYICEQYLGVDPVDAVEEDAAAGGVAAGQDEDESGVHEFCDAVSLDVAEALEPLRVLLPAAR